MAEGKTHQLFQDSWFHHHTDHMKSKSNNEKCTSSSSTSFVEDSMVSNGSSSIISSSDVSDDASSSTSSSLSSNSIIFDLSEIREQLPIKRGLSKFYQGKSESFTSLSKVKSLEDMPKKSASYRKKLKASKSCGNGLNKYKSYTLPKAIISKKASSRGSSSIIFSK